MAMIEKEFNSERNLTDLTDEFPDVSTTEIVDINENIKIFEALTNEKFVEFYEKFLPKLTFFSAKFFNNDFELGGDNAQKSFTQALKKIKLYNPEKAQFSTWLFRVARNEALQELLKNKRIPTVSMDTKIDEDGTTIKDFLHSTVDSDVAYDEENKIFKLKSDIIKSKIALLKKSYRDVIEMRDVKNMTYKNIAEDLGKDIEVEFKSTNGEFIKMENEISSLYSIHNLSDGGKPSYSFRVIGTNPFYTHIKVDQDCIVKARSPRNLSTIKSQIRNGRLKLQNMVKDEFKKIDKTFYQ